VSDKVNNVLFVCSGNSGRSIMAESILGRLGNGLVRAYSVGSHPTGRVNSLALEELARRGYRTDGLTSKSWDEFQLVTSPPLDFVITVCGLVLRENPPRWPGNPKTMFWDFPAPGAVQGSDAQVRQAFCDVCTQIEESIKRFLCELQPLQEDSCVLH
jgi:arsenate reductase